MQQELRKRWILKQPDQDFVSRCCSELKLSALLARIIALRDLSQIDTARCYLSSSLRADLPSPFLMADMGVAVDRIVGAIQRAESISIWGDYDVDGTTGASVLVSFLREIGVRPIFYIPHRIEEGYGLNVAGLHRLKERGVRLVITVDSGISNFNEVAAAREIGVDIVIVDHHQPPERLPPAVAVVNPHRNDCSFPDKGLCAAGLAFYLLIALRARLREAG
jgi:single-stranded-DNA-specific exonuclease